jgi:hypothetical protein
MYRFGKPGTVKKEEKKEIRSKKSDSRTKESLVQRKEKKATKVSKSKRDSLNAGKTKKK